MSRNGKFLHAIVALGQPCQGRAPPPQFFEKVTLTEKG